MYHVTCATVDDGAWWCVVVGDDDGGGGVVILVVVVPRVKQKGLDTLPVGLADFRTRSARY